MFKLDLKKGLNILVGNNEAGKSTILEAIHLALTGVLNGKYLKNELTEYLFNNIVVDEYIKSIQDNKPISPPCILIEIFFGGDDFPLLKGTNNSDKSDASGVFFKIDFDDAYTAEYNELIKIGDIKTIPIEYYSVYWYSFAWDAITPKGIPIKSAFIDSSNNRFQNGSDIYISKTVRENLDLKDIVDISQAHRKMRESFMEDTSILAINKKIAESAKITSKKVALSVELLSKNAWENSLTTCLDDIPFHYIGKGEQCIVKTELALQHKKTKEARVILIEEPENHLSHSKLNQFVKSINMYCDKKQIIISTHNSFIANKLGLKNLILLNDGNVMRLNQLSDETRDFFEKIAGYETLRLVLCKKAILVEGDSDELVVQKAYMDEHDGRLPIEDGVDVISVGMSFLRFLEIASQIDKCVSVVTDNDGNVAAINRKYKDYLGDNKNEKINICFDKDVDEGKLLIAEKTPFNYNTLEPKMLKANDLKTMNNIFKTTFTNIDDMHKHMKNNKTECALKIFNCDENITYPQYILEAIR